MREEGQKSGASKSGAAFIPVDPAYPAERISYIMENSNAACLISSPDVLHCTLSRITAYFPVHGRRYRGDE